MLPPELLAKLDQGLQALQNQDYPTAIAALEIVCRRAPNQQSKPFVQAKMALARAYRGVGQLDRSREVCESLVEHAEPEVQNWARSMMLMLLKQENAASDEDPHDDVLSTDLRAGRIEGQARVSLPRVVDSFRFTFLVTLILPFLLTTALGALPVIILGGQELWRQALAIGGGFALLVNVSTLFFSPYVIDRLNERIFQTQWVNLNVIQKYSPEAGELLLRVCRAEKIPLPKLGLIPDNRPALFTYGIKKNSARLVATQGVFRYLAPDEIATLYAHELGHIQRRDFALMTWISGWGQLWFWGYCELQQWRVFQNTVLQWAILPVITLLWSGFQLNQFVNRYLSRTREYYADHFAVNTTGNPNGLIRALVKMTRALVKQERQAETPALFLQALRNFNSYDPLTAAACERGERFNPQMVGNLLLWDWGSPWRGLLTLGSSHPLLGKRLQVLSHYAEQLDLETEYNLILSRRQVSIQAAKKRNLVLYAEIVVWLLPLWGALALYGITQWPPSPLVLSPSRSLAIGLGVGLLLRTLWQSVGQRKVPTPHVASVLSDPFLSPIWGTQVNWQGKLRLVPGGIWSLPKLYFHDRTGVLPVRYPFWLRFLPPFPDVEERLEILAEHSCQVSGATVRGLSPQLHLSLITTSGGEILMGYPLALSWLLGGVIILLGALLP